MAWTVRGRFADPDLWWHLRSGQLIWDTRSIPLTDSFSWTAAGHMVLPHEWLGQVLIYGAWALGGDTGLALWHLAACWLFILLQFALCTVYSRNVKAGFVGAMIAWHFSTIGLAIRPQLPGYILFTLELLILHFARYRDRRWSWCLPPLLALWINLHGSWSIGMAVPLLVYALSFVRFEAGFIRNTPWPRIARKHLGLACALSVPAVFLNPGGWRQVWFPFEAQLYHNDAIKVVIEWQPLSGDDGRVLALYAVLIAVFLAVAVWKRTFGLLELLLLGGLAVYASRHARMMFVFGAVAAPIMARLLGDLAGRYNPALDRRLPNLVAIAISIGMTVLAFPSPAYLQEQVRSMFPTGAVEYIRKARLTGRMANDYTFGGYLIWALPEHRVAMDGRSDLYVPVGQFKPYMDWMNVDTDPARYLEANDVSFCVLSTESRMINVLGYVPGWRERWRDDVSAVFVRESKPIVNGSSR